MEMNVKKDYQNDSFPKKKKKLNKKLKKIPKLSKLFSEVKFKDFSKHYDIIKELGTGGFAKVSLAKHKITETWRAIKRISKGYENQFSLEIQFLKSLDHPNIIKTFEYSQNDNFYYIVSEYCEGGDFFDFLVKNGIFDEYNAKNYFKQIVQAVNYCHKNNIIHRDIKPENILIMKDENNNNVLKLIDFGFSVKKDLIQKGVKCGSLYYIAPENFKSNTSEKSDIWSLGVILYIMVKGEFPFNGNNLKEIELDIYNKDLDFSQFPQLLGDLLSKMLNKNEELRINTNDILNHIWFVDDNEVGKDNSNNLFFLKRLKRFHCYHSIENLIYFYTTSLLISKEETAKWSSIFNDLDEDNDGKLNLSELVNGFLKIGYLFPEAFKLVQNIFKELNCSEDDGIEFHKFLLICVNKKKLMSKERIKNVFDLWRNSDEGGLTKNHLKEILQNVFPEEILKVVINEINTLFESEIIDFSNFEKLWEKFIEDEEISQSLNISSQMLFN